MQRILSLLIFWFTRLLPKFNWLVIQTFPDFDDNGIAIYDAVSKNKKVTKIIWLTCRKWVDTPFRFNKKTRVCKRNSIKGVCYFIFARYVFFTHGLYINVFPKNQITVNVWHGMPLKGIGRLIGGKPKITSFCLVTAPFFQKLMAQAMGIEEENVIITGLPRNDRMLESDGEYVWRKLGIQRKNYTKVIFWLSTYRKSCIGEIRSDGIDYGNVFNMPDIDIESLNGFLSDRGCLCIVKPHPMAPKCNMASLSNLMFISDDYLLDCQVTLYQLLGQVDVLISDISSVQVDFVLTGRPVILAFPDSEDYANSRKIVVEKSIWSKVGPIVKNSKELFKEIDLLCDGIDSNKQFRNKIKEIYHIYHDSKSTQRLLKRVGLAD